MKKVFAAFVLISAISAGFGQRAGDYRTAGHDNARTSLHVHAGELRPPLELLTTVPLGGETDAESFIVFEGDILAGASGTPVRYTLVNAATGTAKWQRTMAPSALPLRYVPAYANDIVIMGGPATTTVQAVRASTGDVLWSDSSVGSALGRHPVITDNLAVYHGNNAVAARNATTGAEFWRVTTTTAEAGLAVFGKRVYFAGGGGSLQARDIFDGSLVWEAGGVAGNGSTIVASEGRVFVSNPIADVLTALDSRTGTPVWSVAASNFGTPGLALAYNHLIAFLTEDDAAVVRAFDPETGVVLWTIADAPPNVTVGPPPSAGAPNHVVVANNVVYFFNDSSHRIRAIDAFTGVLLWSIRQPGVRGLGVAEGFLLALLENGLQVYAPVRRVFFAQVADGEGATTLLALNNLEDQETSVRVDFFDDSGNPLLMGIVGEAMETSTVELSIAAQETARLETDGTRPTLTGGWAVATSSGRIAGASIFQTGDGVEILFEAGVGDAAATGVATVFVAREENATDGEFNTGVAIANPSDEEATVTIEFRRELPSQLVTSTTIALPPNGHIAQFLHELFAASAVLGSQGTLVITSDLPVAITALRTQNGFQMSSYPVGQAVR